MDKLNNSGIIIEGDNEGDVSLQIINKPVDFKSTIFGEIIKALIDKVDMDNPKGYNNKLFDYTFEEKLHYNNIIEYKDLLEKYILYYSDCQKTINSMDNISIGQKKTFFSSINDKYLKVKGKLFSKYPNIDKKELISKNSDNIISEILKLVKEDILTCVTSKRITQEELDTHIFIVVSYAFYECKILENPVFYKEGPNDN